MKRAIVWTLVCLLHVPVLTQSSNTSEMQEVVTEAYSLIDRYSKNLFPFCDPFVNVFDLEIGEVIFAGLKVRHDSNGKMSSTPLARLSDALSHFHVYKTELDETLIREVLDDSKTVLESEHYKRRDRQSNLLALYYLLDYLRRFNIEVTPSEDEKGAINTKAEHKEQRTVSKSYPHLAQAYKPHTKDTESGKEPGSKEDQVRVAEVNFPTAYFGQRYFAEIVRGAATPFQEIFLPTTFPSPEIAQSTSRTMTLNPLGDSEITLFLPPGHTPFQPVDPRARIGRNHAGGYVLKIEGSLDAIQIPLKQSNTETMLPPIKEIYTRSVGFEPHEWPAKVRGDLFSKYDPTKDHSENPLQVAQAIANHIAGNYLYSVGARTATDPIEALDDGAFQCDMAAYCMVGLLRDVYHIPSRIVGGYRAKKYKEGKNNKSYLVLPGEAHVWVEVHVHGTWHPFDPTPIKKDKLAHEDESGENDDYSDRALENQLKLEQDDTQTKQSYKDDNQNINNLEQLKKDTLERIDTIQQLHVSNNASMDHQELANLLELGSLSLEQNAETNPLRNRAYRFVLQMVLDPNLDGEVITEHLNRMATLFRGLPDVQARSLYLSALEVHQRRHKKTDTWLHDISNLLPSRDIAASYKELYFAKKAIELFARLIDPTITPYPYELLSCLDNVLKDIHNLAHTDSKNIALVNGFLHSLPGMVQELLRRDYGLSVVGPNAPTRKIAQLLQDGELNDYRLLALLNPLTDFVLSAHPRPEYEEVRTWLRDLRLLQGGELLPLQRFSEMAKAVYLNPALGPEYNIRHQMAYVPVTRMRTLIPTGFGKDDAERITIVLYDISGSMFGDCEQFQAGLISAFTAKAISDSSPSGRHRHKVVLIPFDDNPGVPVKVTNTDEALDILRNYVKKFAATGGGTDIQKVLLQALSLIADAEQRSGEPLAAANIILMTDGQASIDIDELARARNAIDRQTPVQLLFVAISGTNHDLITFATEANKAGFEQARYREFTSEQIRNLLQKATTSIPEVDESSIYSEHQASDIPQKTVQTLDRAILLAQKFMTLVRQTYFYHTAAEHLQRLEGVSWTGIEHVNRPLQTWIKDIRKFVYNSVFKDRTLLQRMVNELMVNFKTLTGIDLHELSSYEIEELRHLLRFVDGKEKHL